jgi:hypothetical protein
MALGAPEVEDPAEGGEGVVLKVRGEVLNSELGATDATSKD